MPPFGGIRPVSHDRHKTLPEFILILYDQMLMKITDVKPARTFCQLRAF